MKRRKLLNYALKAALLGAMSITSAETFKSQRKTEPIKVKVPNRIKSGEPFNLRISVSKVECEGEDSRWFEVWLGQKYLGRFEISEPTQKAEFNLTLTLKRSVKLKVRDYYGRIVVKRLNVG
ncbi:MAG: hypothetical protein NZ805_11215 [Armatimonadetes bacterium]|nr:hypothetical protein [Armatimonadota bacterium]MDW8029617.1 hypothetical protein [Armatimonadota bacterium]